MIRTKNLNETCELIIHFADKLENETGVTPKTAREALTFISSPSSTVGVINTTIFDFSKVFIV